MSEFERVTPESVGIDSAAVEAFLKQEKEAGVELHSFMIVRDGKVAAEGWAKPYDKKLRHPMFSFSKTLTATAAGFAVQEGILSLDEKLVDIFPEYCPDVISDNLTAADIRSLLTMSCGHRTEMSLSEASRFGGSWISAFLAHPFPFAPGTVFQYNTWGTDMLSAIIQKKTGQKLTEFLKPRLFDPLGMEDITCASRGMGDDFTRTVEGGGWGMKLTTDDMAKFIWFLEQDGIREGKRLLSHDWIAQLSTKQIETDNPYYNDGRIKSNWLCGYGYQNWQCRVPGVWRADGAFGQFGIVIPQKNAVVILTSCALNTEAELNIVFDTLLPAMHGDSIRRTCADFEVTDPDTLLCAEKLPENQTGESSLRSFHSGWRLPVLWGIRAPLLEEMYGGIHYTADSDSNPSLEDFIAGPGYFEKDGLSVKGVTFRFENNTAFLDFELNRMPERPSAGAFRFDPFSPAGRTIPTGSEHLICHDDDPGTAVKQTLNVGMDGKYRISRLTRYDIAASGTWTSPSAFEISARNTEMTESVRIRCTFFRGMLNLEATGSLPEESALTRREVTGMHFCSED